MKRIFLFIPLLLLVAGCPTLRKLDPPAQEYIKADRLFADLVIPYTLSSIDGDAVSGGLTDLQARTLRDAISNWEFMIERAEVAQGLKEDQPSPPEPEGGSTE